MTKGPSDLERLLLFHLKAAKIPPPELEHRFHPPRRWRFDLAWPDQKLAVEVEGGVWLGGRHTRPAGFEADCEKYNQAALDGWQVLRVTNHMVEDGRALAVIEEALSTKHRVA